MILPIIKTAQQRGRQLTGLTPILKVCRTSVKAAGCNLAGWAKMSSVCRPFPTDVIHTVGPVARNHVGPAENNDLTSCYQNSLRLMKEHGLSTVVSTLHDQAHTREEKRASAQGGLRKRN